MVLRIFDLISFSSEIERLVQEYDLTYLEATTKYTEDTGIDYERVGELLSASILQKLQDEALELNLIPGEKPNRISQLLQ